MERAKQVTMTDLNAAIGVRQPSAHPSPPPLARGAPIPQAMVTSALSPIPWAGDLSCPEHTGVTRGSHRGRLQPPAPIAHG